MTAHFQRRRTFWEGCIVLSLSGVERSLSRFHMMERIFIFVKPICPLQRALDLQMT